MPSPPADDDGAVARRPRGRQRLAALAGGGRRGVVVGVAATVVVIDQLTKTWALHRTREPIHVIGSLQLALTFNPGAAFGLGRGITPVLVLGAIVLVVVMLGLGRAASRSANLPAVIAMGLLLGGACGNLTDRLIRHHHGAVIDFIDPQWWPVFNVADACIVVGALLLVLVGASGHPAVRPDGAGDRSGASGAGSGSAAGGAGSGSGAGGAGSGSGAGGAGSGFGAGGAGSGRATRPGG